MVNGRAVIQTKGFLTLRPVIFLFCHGDHPPPQPPLGKPQDPPEAVWGMDLGCGCWVINAPWLNDFCLQSFEKKKKAIMPDYFSVRDGKMIQNHML